MKATGITVRRYGQPPHHFIIVFDECTTTRLVLWSTMVEMIESSGHEPYYPAIEAWLDKAVEKD